MGWLTLDQEIHHKAALLVEGVNIEPAACEGVGETIMEKVWWLFVYDLAKTERAGKCSGLYRISERNDSRLQMEPRVVLLDQEK